MPEVLIASNFKPETEQLVSVIEILNLEFI
jgi:hypothetical protein